MECYGGEGMQLCSRGRQECNHFALSMTVFTPEGAGWINKFARLFWAGFTQKWLLPKDIMA